MFNRRTHHRGMRPIRHVPSRPGVLATLSLLLCAGVAFAASPLSPPAADQARVRAAAARGDYVPLEQILQDVERRVTGRVLEVEFDDGEYEIEVLREDGVLVELDYDARTGRLTDLDVEDDD